ncbi:MAG TPA: hypothetical protein VK726_15815 [Acetobacteraceae bacterium]|jgi:hypothetical protein|nr:hypothetical protein [Acetobacteraceae bacterium]
MELSAFNAICTLALLPVTPPVMVVLLTLMDELIALIFRPPRKFCLKRRVGATFC